MKKLLIVVASVLLLSFATERTITLKFTETELTKHFNKLAAIRKMIDATDLPHQQVAFMTQSIDSLLIAIRIQAVDQIKDTSKPATPKK